MTQLQNNFYVIVPTTVLGESHQLSSHVCLVSNSLIVRVSQRCKKMNCLKGKLSIIVNSQDAPVSNFVLRKLVPGEPLLFADIKEKNIDRGELLVDLQENLDITERSDRSCMR